MFHFRYILAMASAVIAVMPGLVNGFQMALSQLYNNTVCAMEIRVDVDPNRIPKRILMLHCAEETDKWCKLNGIPKQECCYHRGRGRTMECVQISKLSRVIYIDRNETNWFDVALGCTCMIAPVTLAPDAPGPWG